LVWQNTTSVGCARSQCGKAGTLFHCVFDPRGNYPGLLPYSTTCHPNGEINCATRCGNVWDGCSTIKCSPCAPKGVETQNKRGQCFRSVGCTNSDPNEPIMTGASYIDTKGLTLEKCAQFCVNKGYTYAGVENGTACLCDWTYGDNNAKSCKTPCSGNSQQVCGGKGQVSIYNVEGCTSQPKCQNFGCVKTDDLQWRKSITINSVSGCVNHCAAEGFSYMGISKKWCYCAVGYDNNPLPASQCSNRCGDGQSCGNADDSIVNVYATTGCAEPGYQYTPTFDWRKRGNVVGAVRNQGQCGTCWSFAATSVLESAWAINYNVSAPVLSEQQITTCSMSAGCGGGSFVNAWRFVQQNGGQAYSNQVAPYAEKDQSTGARCETTKGDVKLAPNTATYICRAKATEEGIIKALQYGPIYMGITLASWFGQYSGGVYIDDNWATTPGEGAHAMTIVGYGTEPKTKQDYWIVKNQWGVNFGVNGYVLWARNRAGGTGGLLKDLAQPNIPIPVRDKSLYNKVVQIKHQASGMCVTANTYSNGGELSLAACTKAAGQVFTIKGNNVDKQYSFELQARAGWAIDVWGGDVGETIRCANPATSGAKDSIGRVVWFVESLGNNVYQLNSIESSLSMAAAGKKVVGADNTASGPNADSKWVFA